MKSSAFLSVLSALLGTGYAVQVKQDDWIPYKDEIYIKTFSDLLTYDEAQTFCSVQGDGNEASLVMVKESDLQDLLTNYTQDIVDYIWIGAKYDVNASEFKWEDGNPLTYTNWEEGFPRNVTDGDACIEMKTLDAKKSTKAHGKWAHVTCRRRNLVMCQKRIPWTLEEAVKEIIRVRKEHENDIIQLQKQLEDVNTRVVPVGSIYIEHFNQSSPPTLWPSLKWEDISSSYAGLFFRAYGSGSEEWGVIQAECAPRITHMDYTHREHERYPYLVIPANGWSEFGGAGEIYANGNHFFEGLRFHTEGCEIRPQNQAIRVWKRIS